MLEKITWNNSLGIINHSTYSVSALKIDRDIGYKQGEASDLGNIGNVYYHKGDLDTEPKYYEDALKIFRDIGYKRGEAIQLGNMAIVYRKKEDFRKAEKYLFNTKGIEKESKFADREIDIKALYSRKDPFGVDVTETWLVEIKFYRESRADLQSIHHMANYLLTLPKHFKGLLVTNGQITSTARQWLESIQHQNRIEIRILDSTDLKRILLQHTELIHKYFTSTMEG